MPIARVGRYGQVRTDSHRVLTVLLFGRRRRLPVVEPRPGEEGGAVALEALLQELAAQSLPCHELDAERECGDGTDRPAYEQELHGNRLGVLAEERDVDELVRLVVGALAGSRRPRAGQARADGGGAEQREDRAGREADAQAREHEPRDVTRPEAHAAPERRPEPGGRIPEAGFHERVLGVGRGGGVRGGGGGAGRVLPRPRAA